MQTFTFEGYRVRPVMAEDFDLAREWTEADPDHRGRVAPSFWMEQRRGVESYLVRDVLGPIFFFKMVRREWKAAKRAVELHIQFAPVRGENQRDRLCTVLIQGAKWLEGMLSQSGIEAVVFESTNPALIRFSRKRLGFAVEGSGLSKWLVPPPNPDESL